MAETIPHGVPTDTCGGGARGLFRPGSVLLLDEISASLDEHTERKLMTRIRERYPHKTFICITHRRSVAASFEHVLQC